MITEDDSYIQGPEHLKVAWEQYDEGEVEEESPEEELVTQDWDVQNPADGREYKEPEQDYQCGTQMFNEVEQDSPYWESPPQSPFEYPTVNFPLVDPTHPSYSPPQWDYDQITPIHQQSETTFGMPQSRYPGACPYTLSQPTLQTTHLSQWIPPNCPTPIPAQLRIQQSHWPPMVSNLSHRGQQSKPKRGTYRGTRINHLARDAWWERGTGVDLCEAAKAIDHVIKFAKTLP